MVLEVWFLAQQQHHLGIFRNEKSWATPSKLNQKLWEWGLKICVLIISPDISEIHKVLRTTGMKFLKRVFHEYYFNSRKGKECLKFYKLLVEAKMTEILSKNIWVELRN